MSSIHLNRYFHFTELMRDPAIECELKRYRSEFDGSLQSLFTMGPSHGKSDHTFFFFHGMDGDCGDAVILRDLVKAQNATVIAFGGRGPAWVADSVVADATQIIQGLSEQTKNFYLIGVSMGGTQVLSLAALLPKALRESIAGVVALIPGSNLEAIAKESTHERVRNTVMASSPDLKLKSPISLVRRYRPKLPFVMFYNEEDTLLRSEQLEIFVGELRASGYPVATFSEPGNHDFTFANFDYGKLMRYIGSDATIKGAPLLDPQ
jgi:pimeloyl-ACP methyl ester carboxylesterase